MLLRRSAFSKGSQQGSWAQQCGLAWWHLGGPQGRCRGAEAPPQRSVSQRSEVRANSHVPQQAPVSKIPLSVQHHWLQRGWDPGRWTQEDPPPRPP